MVKTVLFEAQGGGDLFPAGLRALLSRFSTSEYFRAKRLFSFVSTYLVPLGFSRKLKDKGKKSLRAKIFASGKPALRWFQSGRNRLSRIKKCRRSAIGTVVSWSRLCCSKPKGVRLDSRLGCELFYVGFRVEETD